jgi:hypothetical protein
MDRPRARRKSLETIMEKEWKRLQSDQNLTGYYHIGRGTISFYTYLNRCYLGRLLDAHRTHLCLSIAESYFGKAEICP